MQKTVAVFDDDESVCKMVERLVAKQGMVCISATSLPEAAYVLGNNSPHIIVADFEFQHGLNISAIADNLKEMADEVYILTSHDPENILKRYPQLSFAKFVRKGTPLNRLVEQFV